MSTPTKNGAWTIPSSASQITDLTKLSLPLPTPGPNQALIRITAASLNYRDLLIATRSPQYPGDHKPNLVPCSDGAGIIHSTHPTSRFASQIGLSVILHPSNWFSGNILSLRADRILGGSSMDGTLQEWMVVDDERILAAPKGWSGEEVAGLFTAGGTAWAAIKGSLDGTLDGELGAWKGGWTEKKLSGKTVLTQGTGGVSCAAIQIAAALGATVIVTSSSDAKLEVARSLGATHLINYKKTPEWDKEVLRVTEGNGVDHVIELGGAQTLMQSLNSTRMGGLISVIGILTTGETIPAAFIPAVLFGAKIVKGCTAFSRDTASEYIKFSEANNIKPVIAETFSFDQVVESFEALQKQNAIGKLVVKISED